jgi:ribosomal 30S subunit maturation factor RimM
MAKPFGKSGFGEGQEGSYYFKELQTGRILKKLELVKSKLGDIKKIVTLLENKINEINKEKHGHK